MSLGSDSHSAERRFVVFGGTGFLGRRIVATLLDGGHRVVSATRHPQGKPCATAEADRYGAVRADLRDDDAVRAAVTGADGVVNAVGLYMERGEESFRAIHVDGAGRLATRAAEAGVARLVHLSGIGADTRSPTRYIRCRGQGEVAVREAFPDAIIFRPSVMFGPDDAFLATLVALSRRLPVIPLFGSGETRLQPVYVGDVAEAAALVLTAHQRPGRIFELGGPEIYSYRTLLETVAEGLGVRRRLLPVPYRVWRLLAAAVSLLPSPPLTRDQVALMQQDNVASPHLPGLSDLGVAPTALDEVLAALAEPG